MEEPMRQFLDFLALAEFSQATLLIFILLVMDRNRRAKLFFATFIFILSSNFFLFYLFKTGFKYPALVFAAFSIPGISLSGVFIYFYTLFVTGLLEKFSKRHLAHFVVYFVSLILFIVLLLTSTDFPERSHHFKKYMFLIINIGLVNSIIYIVYTIIILGRYYHKIENYYSDLERMSLNWLKRITTLAFIALLFWCVGFWFSHLNIIPRNPAAMALNIIMLIIIIFITAYYLINQPEIFKKNIEMEHSIDDSERESVAEKYARQSIDESMQDDYLARLNNYMSDHKPYLEENITIKDLAEEIGIPAHHLSIVINNRLNKNFYTFINEYRIKEAVSILDDPHNSDASIIAVAFRSGFNSKSTFNSVFKKITGFTPSEYRNRSSFRSELAS